MTCKLKQIKILTLLLFCFAGALCSPMLLSTFSHFSLFHMAANMYVLWSFSSSIVSLLGCEQFIAVYLSAGNVKYIYLQHLKIQIHVHTSKLCAWLINI